MVVIKKNAETMVDRALWHALQKFQPNPLGVHEIPCPYCLREANVP